MNTKYNNIDKEYMEERKNETKKVGKDVGWKETKKDT